MQDGKGKLRVYIAGPYTGNGEAKVRQDNTLLALDLGNRLLELSFQPFIPHLSHFWDLFYPKAWSEWMDYDDSWLRCCDAVIRILGKSEGADVEVSNAKALGIPVFYRLEDLVAYRKSLEGIAKAAPISEATWEDRIPVAGYRSHRNQAP